jgi:hypothetical protein
MSKTQKPKTKNPRDEESPRDVETKSPRVGIISDAAFRGVGWAKVKGGYVACLFTFEDGEWDAEPIDPEPVPRLVAIESMKLALVRKVIPE